MERKLEMVVEDGCHVNFVGVIGKCKVHILCCWPNVFLYGPECFCFWPLQLAKSPDTGVRTIRFLLPSVSSITSKYYDLNHEILQCRELGWVGMVLIELQ
jgi:hypothetical protein